MSMGTLSMVAQSVSGVLHGADRTFDAVSTDTRSLAAGELFVALRGPRFDAADFIAEAERLGAAGAVVERRTESRLAQVEVDDTRRALGDLARSWRRTFELPLIGVTGSNGKTTVKDMCAAVMRAHCGDPQRVLATRGNLNNDVGLPLMTLELRASHRAAVLEMGASAAGEIAYLAGIAQPTVGIVTNAGPAHLEGFGSIAGVASGKGELFSALPASGTAVINRDDDYFEQWRQLCGRCEIRSFGLHPDAAFRAEAIRATGDGGLAFEFRTPEGGFAVRLPMVGRHNVRNALAAGAAALAAGATEAAVQAGLAGAAHAAGRLRELETRSGARLFDDSYNANPASLRAAMEFLAAQPGETWLVAGDMLELGPDSERLHREAGQAARELGIDRFLCVGAQMRAAAEAFGPRGEWFAERGALVASVAGDMRPGLTLLVKGSRSMSMELVARELAAAGGGR